MIQRGREKPITAEEVAGLGAGPCELVRGRIVGVSPAGKRHGGVVRRVIRLVDGYAAKKKLGGVTSGESGFLVRRDPDTVRAPDVAFLTNATLERFDAAPETYYPGPPDLAIEVLSPDDRWDDVQEKVRDHLDAGSLAVWVLSPSEERVYAYEPKKRVQPFEKTDTLQGGAALPGFKTKVSAFFSDPPRRRRP